MRNVLKLTNKFNKDIYKTYKCGFEWLLHENEFENIIKLYNFNEHINNKGNISNISEDQYADFCEYKPKKVTKSIVYHRIKGLMMEDLNIQDLLLLVVNLRVHFIRINLDICFQITVKLTQK
ncbi:VIR-like CYIR protein [Plasmodium cynomolgi strain B]|uniref:VIR-like CYIR protein n=1 Tax=Plasmodium cynomolgi (strain B) TaxID=1120755 RepID=K6URZ1_PLACD|nr:VIR-like CYIR protein [Plasmodium cynomolgi strain B]GAB65939.1 VIR-like CYIR protein [Plasmodium cynomolgi strain B]